MSTSGVRGRGAAIVRTLQQCIDRDGVLGQDAGDPGEHASFVGDLQPQVVRRDGLIHRQDRCRDQRVVLEREVRHAVMRAWRESMVAR